MACTKKEAQKDMRKQELAEVYFQLGYIYS